MKKSARRLQNQNDWQALKQSLVNHVKNAPSLQDFLLRLDEYKKPLQFHYDIETNEKGEIINQGSRLYRFFHYFNPYKSPILGNH